MSAYIVNDFHINALVTYGVEQKAQFYTKEHGWTYFTDETAHAIASLLYRANVQSVNRRYGERVRSIGFVYKKSEIRHLTAADIVRACDCLDYQSCERTEWERSRARKALQSIREKAIDKLVKHSGAWELQDIAKEAG